MDTRELEPRAKRGRESSGDALASSLRGFRSGAGVFSQGLTHFRTTTGSRATGQSAAAKFDYINREGKYAKGREKADYMESGNLPEWAKVNPRAYWESADEYERANGRLFVNSEFALPYGLTEGQQIALASETAKAMAMTKDGQQLPYSFAIHGAKGHNPHMHLIISERGLDGNSRSAETWFKKAPTGARKTTDLQHPDWVRDTRREWCARANKYLEAAGAESRLDHRSFKEQGVDRLPTVHVGYTDPKRPQVRQQRQERNESIKLANSAPEARKDLAKAEQHLAKVNEALRQIEARAAAEKAAALAQVPQEQSEAPRRVHGQAQPKDQVLQPTPPKLAEAARVQLEGKTYQQVLGIYEQRKGEAARPAPTFQGVFERREDYQQGVKSYKAAREARERWAPQIEADKRDYAKSQAELERRVELFNEKAKKGVGIWERVTGRGELNDQAGALREELAELERFKASIATAEKAQEQRQQVEKAAFLELAELHKRESLPGSVTHKELALELEAHRTASQKAAREVQALAPYVVERKQRLEQEKTQAKAPVKKDRGRGRGGIER